MAWTWFALESVTCKVQGTTCMPWSLVECSVHICEPGHCVLQPYLLSVALSITDRDIDVSTVVVAVYFPSLLSFLLHISDGLLLGA